MSTSQNMIARAARTCGVLALGAVVACSSDDDFGSTDDVADVQGGSFVRDVTEEPVIPSPPNTTPGDTPPESIDPGPGGGPLPDGRADADASDTQPLETVETWPTLDQPSAGTPVYSGSGNPTQGGPSHRAEHPEPGKGIDRSGYVPDGSEWVTFEELASFWYVAPDPEEVVDNPDFAPEDQFPGFVKKLDGKTVTVEGYVVPISIEKGRVKSFILSRYVQNCCFGGGMPELNEWVEVDMPEGEGLDFLPYGTVLTTGELSVGETFDEYGYVRSVYRIKAGKVVEPDY